MPKDWGRHKAEIERLYIAQGEPLKEVQRLLKGRHDFNASIRAYRMKLDEWGMRKNGIGTERPNRSGKSQRAATKGGYLSPASDPTNPQVQAHLAGNWSHDPFALPMNSARDLSDFEFAASMNIQNLASNTDFHTSNAIDARDLNGPSTLHDAISFGTVEDVSNILSSGAPTGTWNSRGNQPLHEAVIKNDVPMVKALLRYGADVDSPGAEGKIPLHLAAPSLEIMDLLLKQRPAVSHQDLAGNTALQLLLKQDQWWTWEGCASTISTLLTCGADINIINNAAESALHLLVAQILPDSDTHVKLLVEFLEHNPDISIPMSDGSTLFETLLGKLRFRLTRQREVSISRRLRVDLIASERQCLNRFLSLGADANTVVTKGRSLLCYCLEEGIFLRDYGQDLLLRICQLADVNIAGLDGNYPLHYLLAKPEYLYTGSRGSSKLKLLNEIIDQNPNVNQKNSYGKSPLESLLEIYSLPYLNLSYAMPLLKAGANSTLLLSTGKTLFDLIEEVYGTEAQIEAVLEADLAYQPPITKLTEHAAWTIAWRAACNEPKWVVAKHLLQFEDSYPRPTSKKFLNSAFIVVAENLLKMRKAQLVLWQAGRLDHEAARSHRQEYVAILKDCNERQANIDPSWYKYLLEIMDFN